MSEEIIIQELHRRRNFFAEHFPAIMQGDIRNGEILKNTCPACGYPTLGERWSWEICAICWWQDDGQDDSSAEEVWGGPNSTYSLVQYRIQTANILSKLKSCQPEASSPEAVAGQELDKLQHLIDAYQPQDEAVLQQQMDKTIEAFDKVGKTI